MKVSLSMEEKESDWEEAVIERERRRWGREKREIRVGDDDDDEWTMEIEEGILVRCRGLIPTTIRLIQMQLFSIFVVGTRKVAE